MRSIRLLAVTTTVLVLGSACGGDGPGGGEQNQPPVADFPIPTTCVANSACNFTSTGSSDDEAITTYSWDFDGAGTAPPVTTSAASYTFTSEGSYPVTLTVGDAEGLTHSVTKNVVVAAATPGNTPPVANFEVTSNPCIAGTPCGFNDLSTDADVGATLTGSWDFGDGNTAVPGLDLTHTFEDPGSYNVTLTVTDNAGASNAITLPVTVTPQAAGQDCTTTGGTSPVVDCALTVDIRSTVKFTVVSESCDFTGNRLEIDMPTGPNQIIFFNLCNQSPGAEYTVLGAGGTPLVFEAGSVLNIHFVRGAPGENDPPAGDPGIQFDGTSPSWTLNIDDGGAFQDPGEPDFNDAIIAVQATAAP
jgi:PKD repeat protein